MSLKRFAVGLCLTVLLGITNVFNGQVVPLEANDLVTFGSSGGSLMLQSQDAPPPTSADSAFARAEGTWTFQSYGSASIGDDDAGQVYAGHFGFGYFIDNQLSLNLDFFGGQVDPSRDDNGGVGGLDMLVRWHWLNSSDWSVYLDGGGGFQQATTHFPSDSHHNFRLLVGLGATLRLTDRLNLMAGVRYIHISNASTTDNNDGLNAAQVYLGLMLPF